MVDRTLTYTKEIIDKVSDDFNKRKTSNPEVKFEVWTEIPEVFQYSYYLNEQLINPVKESFDAWKIKLSKRQEPIYSVALNKDSVVSSVFVGAGLIISLTMNLWITKPDFEQKGIGKTVLLNLIRYCFENIPDLQIVALDVTSEKIDNILINIGFT